MVFFEQSQRGDDLLECNLPVHTMDACNLFGRQIQVVGFTLPKKSMEPGLELADLIIHTSGKQQRKHAEGYRDGKRYFTPDFRAVFHSVPPTWVLYSSLTAMEDHSASQVMIERWPEL
jgi:hypothetical protein